MYQKTNWQSGDTITAAKLNNIENGIAGGGVLVVSGEMSGSTLTLDKTWNEINNASLAVLFNIGGDTKIIMICCEIVGAENDYRARFTSIDSEAPFAFTFSATSADGYPSYSMG